MIFNNNFLFQKPLNNISRAKSAKNNRFYKKSLVLEKIKNDKNFIDEKEKFRKINKFSYIKSLQYNNNNNNLDINNNNNNRKYRIKLPKIDKKNINNYNINNRNFNINVINEKPIEWIKISKTKEIEKIKLIDKHKFNLNNTINSIKTNSSFSKSNNSNNMKSNNNNNKSNSSKSHSNSSNSNGNNNYKNLLQSSKNNNNNNFINFNNNNNNNINLNNNFKFNSNNINNNNNNINLNENTLSYTSKDKNSSSSSTNNKSAWFQSLSKQIPFDPFLKKIYNINNMNFKIGEILFEGQTSIIYKVLNLQSGKIFVIKRYYDFKYYDLYINEIEIYKKINYKRIIKYFGNYCNKNENEFFIYLKFAENGNLKNLIDLNGPLKENLIKKFLIQILKILNYLHNKLKIAHRDIKSSNFLLGSKNELFLSDFGCSEKINESNENLYGLKGTLPFCAPEILAGKKYSTKCDIWSLGCTIIEMGGMSPWQGKKLDNYYQCITIIVKSDDVPEIPGYFCEDLKDFVLKCFERDVDKRFDVEMLMKHKFVC